MTGVLRVLRRGEAEQSSVRPRRGSFWPSAVSYCVRSLRGSCSMFVPRRLSRGEGSAGRHAGQDSVSALMFDYILQAHQRSFRGQYLGSLINDLLASPLAYDRAEQCHGGGFRLHRHLYFWWQNSRHTESSEKPCASCSHHRNGGHPDCVVRYTVWLRHSALPLFQPGEYSFSRRRSAGCMKRPFANGASFSAGGIFVALGHSVLAMSVRNRCSGVPRNQHPS